MDKINGVTYDLYRDIRERTGGEIYLGVVGPVRSGKSTFIKRFMELLVLPEMEQEHERQRAVDELPQSAAGKTIMTAGCGVLLSKAAMQAAERGLTGFEFAGGIPGTLGGAVTMNAGAYGGEIRDVILSARVMTKAGDVRELSAEELDLSYRHSIIQEKDLIVLSADFAFAHGDEEQIKEQMRQLNTQRREKQPLEYGSAGSTFKRPEGYFAGKLIQDAGLKGYRSGDVMVSEKHSGFVVNVGKGTCGDAMRVIEHVQRTVYEQFGVELELEVKRV